MTAMQIVWTLIKILIMVGFLFNTGAVLTWLDRRQSAMIQDRIGPNRAVIKIFGAEFRLAGLLHTAADGIKFFFKEDFIPPNADRLLFGLAPMLAMVPVLVLVAVIPFGDTLSLRELWRYGAACTLPARWDCIVPVAVGAVGVAVVGGWALRTKVGAGSFLVGLFAILVLVVAGVVIARAPWSTAMLYNGKQCVDAAGNAVDHASVAQVLYFPAVQRFGAPNPDLAPVELMVAPLNVGLLFVFALAGQGIVGAAIAGWSSDNKFSLMGALRAASQMVSYEVTIGLSLVGAMMVYGTIRLDEMVRWQGDHAWGIFVQPVAFFLFFAASVAEAKRIPFDLPEAESELVSGYFTEYSGMKFGMFYFAEYMEVVTGSMLLVTLFLGGWQLPFLHRDGITVSFGAARVFSVLMPHIWVTILQVFTFFGKVLVVCWLQAFVRWSLPRFRYDQLMKLCWRTLLPLSLANIMATGIVILALGRISEYGQGGWRVAADVTQAVVLALLVAAILAIAFGLVRPQKHVRSVVGSSARFAKAKGGTKTAAMQA